MPEPTPDPPPRSKGKLLSAVSFTMAALSLAVSVFTFFNGSSKQAQFETNRQQCVEALNQYGRTLLDLQMTETRLTSAQTADYVFDGARARISCFDSGVLDRDSQFLSDWITAERAMQLPIALLGREDSDHVLHSASRAMVDDYITRILRSIDEALVIAITTPGPGILPWQDPTPTAPASFAPVVQDTETPSPSP